jgi:hypothetical protein
MFETIKQVVLTSGLWNNGRAQSHHFVLSPSVYKVSEEKRSKLEAIGIALHDCMAGLGRIAAIAMNPKIGTSNTWKMVAKALYTGVPTIYRDIMTQNPSKTPGICKVDFMESLDGSFRIAEIDGHNKHGLGYSTLARRICQTVKPEALMFPGVAAYIFKEISDRGHTSATLLYSDQERFYLPEFQILQNELAKKYLVDLKVVMESDFDVNGNQNRLFVDFPFMYRKQELNTLLANRYQNGEIDFIIPPKPFLGSKVVLALIRNDTGDVELEGILRSQIPLASLNLLREHIPETYLVHKYGKKKNWMSLIDGLRFVLKESVSSGMKGVVFSDDANFEAIMKRACDSYYRFVLQEEVDNRSTDFQYYGDNGELLAKDDWFMRVTVHYALRSVADVVVTATRNKRVHGGKGCLQLGAIKMNPMMW